MKKYFALILLLFVVTISVAQEPFVTTWEVYDSDLDIEIPTIGDGYNYTIEFGDGASVNNVTGNISHTYAAPGIYTISISGDFPRIYLYEAEDTYRLRTIEQWGDIEWQSMNNAFRGCTNLILNATDAPDLSQVTDLSAMFQQAEAMNTSIEHWDVSSITNMSHMFDEALDFNQPLNDWDVSNVTDMSYMFYGAGNTLPDFRPDFNQPLNNWDVSSVTDMSYMFSYTFYFNQPIDNWDTSNVITMGRMFSWAQRFNQNIDSWDVSNVTNMSYMFLVAGDFNQPLNSWDVSNVTNMSGMFRSAFAFNQPLNNWDVSNVTNMASMFRETFLWATSSFNQPIGDWDVSNVLDMSFMFAAEDSPFDQPLNNWDVSNVLDMSGMFSRANNFNQPLNSWDVSNVEDFGIMFSNAASFNQDLSDWVFNPNAYFKTIIKDSGLDPQNYDIFLLKLTTLNVDEDQLSANGLGYCNEVVRNDLVDNLGWTITNDELSPDCFIVNGNILYDQDNDGCDTDDLGVTGFMVSAINATDEFVTFSNNGAYALSALDDSYVVSIQNMPDYFDADPITTDVDFNGEAFLMVDFCITANETIEDLKITILPITEARPGFESSYQLLVENMGTQHVADATVNLTFDDAGQIFILANPAPVSTTVNTFTFQLSNLAPLSYQTIDFTMETFTPPTVNGDDVLVFNANILPDVNDNTPEDNNFLFEQIVVNSFDPNDKQVVQGEEIYEEQVDEYLDYIIRFQNTGTASAINVRIEDVLDDKLDWSTIQPLSSSHNYVVEITDGNYVKFIFDNIFLPHEDANEAGSNGYITYKIKPKSNVVLGDVISGDASIFFDFNAPIITNTVTTTVVEFVDLAPEAICQDMQVELDETGSVLLDAALLGENSTDDIGIESYEASPSSFNCSQIGFQTVTLTVTDTAGNQNTCDSIVEVVDSISPVVECPEENTVIITQGEIYVLPDYYLSGEINVTDNCTTEFTNYTQDPDPDTELTAGVYEVNLQFFDESNNESLCSFLLTVEEVLGVDENDFLKDNINIFPNPISNTLEIQLSSQVFIENVEVITISGKKLFETNNTSIDFSALQAGLYFLEIETSKGTITKKVFKK